MMSINERLKTIIEEQYNGNKRAFSMAIGVTAVPFVAALLVCLAVIVAFPSLSTLLPALMKG